MKINDLQNLLNIRQACKILSVHPDTLRRWERDGKLTSIRIGPRKDRRYRIADIYGLIDQTTSKTQKIKSKDVYKGIDTWEVKKAIEKAECILFDLSDTLMLPFPSRGDIIANVAYAHGFNLSPEILEKNYHKLYDDWEKEKLFSDFSITSSEKVREKLFTKLNADVMLSAGIPEDKKQEALRIGKKVYLTVTGDSSNWRTFPDVIPFLKSLPTKKKLLAIVDNWNRHLHGFVKKSELNPFFKFVISGGELEIRKPEKEIFEIALRKAKVKSDEAVYIGNRYIDDVLGPKKAGIRPIIFDYKRKYIDERFLKFYTYKNLI